MKIGIIDYGMGNLQSVQNALDYIGIESFVSSNVEELKSADKLILPGVGAFKDAIQLIKEKEINIFINDTVKNGTPILGICLGMQLMFDESTEFGLHQGLSLLPGKIVRFDTKLKVPHMGWNKLNVKMQTPLFNGLPENSYVYFVHSYHLETDDDIVSATTFYDGDIQIAAQKDNVYALQFHPEKSGDIGLQILRNFSNL